METTKRGLDISNPEHIIYVHSGIEIAVLGGIRLEGLDRMRATLKIQVEHLSIRHNLDLYNDSQVEKLVRKVAEKLEVGTSIITAALNDLTDELEKYRLGEIEKHGAQIYQAFHTKLTYGVIVKRTTIETNCRLYPSEIEQAFNLK